MDPLLQSIESDVRTIGEILVAAPDATVRDCPGWTVADLVQHHGEVHRWSTGIVLTGEPGSDDFPVPADLAARAAWYAEGAAALVDALATTDPDRACWTFGRPPAKAWFWTRRQALEAAIHRWDAETAAGVGRGFPAGVAEAGITEVVEDMFPRQVALDRTPALGAPVSLKATDIGRIWTIGPEGEAAAEVAGPAEALLLLLWRRTDLEDEAITFTGPDSSRTEVVSALFAP